MTTINVPEQLKKKLDELKVHPREPYKDVIARLVEEAGKE
jgi:hypothetical protein